MEINYWYWSRVVVRLLFIFVIVSPIFGATFFIGTYSSGLLFGKIHLSDPFAGIQIMLANPAGIATSFIISVAIVLTVYAMVGRVYCSWVCPFGLLIEFTDKIPFSKARNEKLNTNKIEQMNEGKNKQQNISSNTNQEKPVKYGILITSLVVALAVSIPVFELFSPMSIFMRLFLFGIGLEVIILFIVVLANRVYGAGTWCNKLCPLGAFYTILGAKRLLAITLDESQCIQCGDCYTKTCNYGSSILETAVFEKDTTKITNDCTNCGDCISACKYHALRFSIRDPFKVTIDNKQISLKR